MKAILLFLVLAVFAGMALADVDVTGKWSGSFNSTTADGETRASTALLVLKQSGTEITGTAGPDESEQHPIRKGKIDGDKITLEVDNDGHTMNFELVLAGGRMTGDAQVSRGGQTLKAKIDVTRAK